MYKYLLLLTIAGFLGLQGWRTLFNNFAVDIVKIDGFQIGAIQSIREIPGFLALLIVYILLIVKEHRIAALSIIILGIGITITGSLPSFSGLILTTFIMSIGFHYFETANKSLTLQYFSHTDAPHILGRLRSIGSITCIVAGTIIWIFSKYLKISTMFSIVGLPVIAIGFYVLFKNPVDKNLTPQHKKMIFKKKYWLFYTLNFLSGARRQIFTVFAVLLLVKHYNYSVEKITILFVINNIITFFINPLIARYIIKFGERKVLSVEYFSLIFVFLGYAFIDNPLLASILYIIDHVVFNFSMGIQTFFQKNADPRDIAPSMAMGFTINHISAVVIPVCGGLLWILNWQIPFIVGAGLSLISLFFVQKIKVNNKEVTL